METKFDEIEYKGHTIECHYDDSPANPKEEWDECSKAEYQAYLNGEVYGYCINGSLCTDSCWGFYGHTGIASMIEEYAKPAIDYALEQDQIAKECVNKHFAL